MKQLIVLFSVLSISILVLASIATKMTLNGKTLGGDPIDPLSLVCFYIMGVFFGAVAITLINKQVEQDIEESFSNLAILDEED
ncbi:MAG: hypothetical protein WC719_04545 [Patescibacteria group bacterium]|jgi:uncharacterized membrane protein